MSGEVELVGDGEGVIVAGDRSAVERFLDHAGLLTHAQELGPSRLGLALRLSAEVADTASGLVEHSALYLKLTPESARRLRDAGGLMKTKSKGISHAMLGETGQQSLKWLQVETGPVSLLANPAVLSGIGGLMSQMALQSEAQELRTLLVTIDGKLDDVRRSQRDAVLARVGSAAVAIEEAIMIRDHGGDPKTLWDKVSGVSESIHEAQERSLLELHALADRVERTGKAGELKATAREVEREVAVQLAVLARCFELQDEFRAVELEHVLATAPDKVDGHRLGVARARARRRERVVESTARLMVRIDAAGEIANQNILLHARAALHAIDSLNSIATTISDFHTPLGIESSHSALSTVRWREAFRDPQKLRTAGQELGHGAIVGIGAVGAVGATMYALLKDRSRRGA